MLDFFGKGNEILNQRNSDQLCEVKIADWKTVVCPAQEVFAGSFLFSNLVVTPKILSGFRRQNKPRESESPLWSVCVTLTTLVSSPLPHLHMDHSFIIINFPPFCSLGESWKDVTMQNSKHSWNWWPTCGHPSLFVLWYQCWWLLWTRRGGQEHFCSKRYVAYICYCLSMCNEKSKPEAEPQE